MNRPSPPAPLPQGERGASGKRAAKEIIMRHAVLAALALLAAALPAPAATRPNVLVLLADDLGYADLSVQGSREVATPHIDSLAKDGVRCTSGYVSGPYCSPTRAGLMTGRYQQRFGHEFNPELLARGGAGQGLSVAEVTVADRLKAAG